MIVTVKFSVEFPSVPMLPSVLNIYAAECTAVTILISTNNRSALSLLRYKPDLAHIGENKTKQSKFYPPPAVAPLKNMYFLSSITIQGGAAMFVNAAMVRMAARRHLLSIFLSS